MMHEVAAKEGAAPGGGWQRIDEPNEDAMVPSMVPVEAECWVTQMVDAMSPDELADCVQADASDGEETEDDEWQYVSGSDGSGGSDESGVVVPNRLG